MKKQVLSMAVGLFAAGSLMAQLPVSQTPSNKNVVLEEFTGIYCVFCPDGHKIAQQIKDANPNDVILVNIHTGGYADPDPGDPDFRTPFGAALANQSGLSGYPSGTVNRHVFSGGVTAMGRGDWSSAATTILGESSYLNVALEGTIDVQTRLLTVNVEVYYTGNGAASNKLNVALLQNHVEGPQTGADNFNPAQVLPNGNYDHMHMLRHFLTGQWGDTITTTAQGTLVQRQYTYTIPADLNGVAYELGNLSIVAYVAEGNQEIISGAEGPIQFILPNGYTEVDLASSPNTQMPATYCENTVTPSVTINNVGNNDVSSYEVSYTLNGGTPVTQTVNSTLASGANNTITFPSITLSQGENKLAYSVSSLSTTEIELVTGNNSSASSTIYTLSSSATGATRTEGFEGASLGDAAPANAVLDNPQGTATFVVSNAINSNVTQEIGGFGNSSNSYRWDFYSISAGKSSKLVFRNLDFSQGTGYGLKFNHAYAQYQSENDKLEVLVSTDCGATWSSVYVKAGNNLKTAQASQNRFYPAVSEWANNTVDLSAYDGQSNVMIAFEGTSDYGNNLYIDDIQILDATTLSVEDLSSENDFNVYPNPSQGVVNLSLSLQKEANVSVRVYNGLGELVADVPVQSLAGGMSNIEIDLSALESGIYFAAVVADGKTITKQISIVK